MDLHGRSLLKETDLSADEFRYLVDQARELRADKRRGVTGTRLTGRNIALIFEKTSTRTRSGFEVGADDEAGMSPTSARESPSWATRTAATLGMDARICAPAARQPAAEIRAIADGLAAGSGARLLVTDDIGAGTAGADFVYADVWLSLGEPEDQWDERISELLPYQVNAAVMKGTGNPAAKFLHCLPALHNRDTEIGQRIYARRGLDALEVTDEVFESPASVVFDQAENRMHTIKALMIATLGPRR